MKSFLSMAILSVLLLSCGKKELNQQTAEKYYNSIASGNYIEAEEYLSSTFVYEDVIFKQEYANKEEYVRSLAPDSSLHFQCDKILDIENISSQNDSLVWVKGTYCGYTYKEKEIQPMRFVSLLYFTKEGKIYRQEDWKDHSLEGIISMYQFRNSYLNSN